MKTARCWGVLVLSLVIVLLLASGWGAATPQTPEAVDRPVQWEKVAPGLLERLDDLETGVSVEVVLRLSQQADLQDTRFQRSEVVHRLQTAARSQALLLPYLEDAGFTVKRSFWIVNALVVEGPVGQVGELTRPDAVARVVDNFEVSLVDGSPSSDAEATSSFTWGLARIGVDQVWSEIGVQGGGIRVCVSDTGVDTSHPDLEGRMWSDVPGDPEYPGGWIEFDSGGNPVAGSTPHDTHGHGTHTSGTVLGGEASGVAIGVAPGAALMHALVLPGGGGTFAQVIAGIEWCVSPYDDDGNPAGEPAEVHSMSWGATGYWDEMVDPIRNSYFAGTVPVAAAGNCGEGCSGSPGNLYDALGIGASDESDLIASFSSGETIQKSYWGSPPADWPDEWVVPLLSAPGVNVYSSLPGGGYDYWAGTSMAAPHVAGCAALMLSANPAVTPADVRDTLVATAMWFDTYSPSPPDTRYGWGRIDCMDAVETVAFNSGIAGTLRDKEDAMPVDQAYVNVSSVDVQRQAVSTADGTFRLSLKPGTYNLSAERFGYEPLSAANLTVVQDQWVNLDLDLVPRPRGNVTGTAFHSATGIGVPGVTVTILNVPVVMTGTTEGSGAYALPKVPEGTYALQAASPYLLDGTATGVVVVEGATTTVDFYLDPRDWVGIMGDQGDGLSRLARDNGYYVENPDWSEVINDAGRYRVVVVNHPFFPGTTTFNDFLSATDAAGTGVVFLDTWEHTFTGGGIYYLWNYLADPATRSYADDWTANHLYYRVSQTHPILDPHGVGDVVILEDRTVYHDHAWFDLYSGENGTVLAQAGIDPQGDLGPGIAVDERANNRHVLLSMHGASNYIGPEDWTANGTEIFLNAVNWSRASSASTALPVDFDLRVNPPVGLWYETFAVSIQAKNVGSATGNYTARLYVDGWVEAAQTVSLTAGETRAVTFNVARDPVGTYAVTLGPHATTFQVRPPRVSVQAVDLDGSPVADGRVAVGLGSAVLEMGTTDPNGSASFDSPSGSHGQYWIILQAFDVGIGGMQYFLTQEMSVEDDIVVAYQPTANTTAILDLQMESVTAGQQATIYLRRDAMPDALGDDFGYYEGSVLVERAGYSLWTLTTVETLQSTWSFTSDNTMVNVTTVSSAAYLFGGALQVALSESQAGTFVSVDWEVTDAHGIPIVRVTESRVGILGAGETTNHLPFLSLWEAQGALLASGYVEWSQKPANVTLASGETVAFVHLDLETGPYAFHNVFELLVEVRDGQGAALPNPSATPDESVQVEGAVLRGGEPVPASVTVNGQAVLVNGNGTFSTTVNLTDGFNNVTIEARDLAGHTRVQVFLLLSKPGVLLSLEPTPGITNVAQVAVQGIVEPGAQLTVNGQETLPDEDGFFSVTLTLAEGENTLVVAAEDYLGTRKEIVRTVTLDTARPEITIVVPSPGQVTRDEQITFVGETEPEATLTINGESVPLDNGSFTYVVALQEGDNALEIRAVDRAGNVGVETLTVHRESAVTSAPLSPLLFIVPVVAAAGLVLSLWMWRRHRPARPGEGSPPEGEEIDVPAE